MVNKIQLKRYLESPRRLNEYRGLAETQYEESPVCQCAKRAIANALFKYHLHDLKEPEQQASAFINEADVVLVDGPRDEVETLSLLEKGVIEYPDFSNGFSPLKNTLNHLFCIWVVRGYHRREPRTHVEMLIGGYWTLPSLVPLGRRDKYEWVSPVYTSTQ